MTFLNFFLLANWCHYSYISLKWKAMDIRRVWTFSMLITPKNALIKMSLTLRKELLLESFQCCFQPQKPETAKTWKMENLKQNTFFHFMRDFDAVLNFRVYLTIAFRISSDKTYYMVLGDVSLREKRPNAEFFLVHIFLYLDWIQRITE